MPAPVLRMLELSIDRDIPDDPERLVTVIVKLMTLETEAGRAPGPAVFTLAGRTLRYVKWVEVDDPEATIRGLVVRHGAEAVALTVPIVPPEGIGAEAAWGVTIEARGGAVDKVVAFRRGGAEHRVLACRPLVAAPGWLDSGPEHDVEMVLQGPVGMVGPTAEG